MNQNRPNMPANGFSQPIRSQTNTISTVELDIILCVTSYRIIGLINIICSFLCPIATLICSNTVLKRCKKLNIPAELTSSLQDAFNYNETASSISIIFLIVEIVILSIILFGFIGY